MQIDYLVLAAHPDDAELFCGGTLIKMRQRGYQVGVLDFTRGEAGSSGTVAERDAETRAATEILGLHYRHNLGLPDGGLRDDFDTLKLVVDVIRRRRVQVLIAPLGPCRHPDHTAVSEIARKVHFFAGNAGFPCAAEPWRPLRLLFHLEFREVAPSFVIDVGEQFDDKLRAIHAYATQFWQPGGPETGTVIGSRTFHEKMVARFKLAGAQVGCDYAEPFVCEDTLRLDDPLKNHREG